MRSLFFLCQLQLGVAGLALALLAVWWFSLLFGFAVWQGILGGWLNRYVSFWMWSWLSFSARLSSSSEKRGNFAILWRVRRWYHCWRPLPSSGIRFGEASHPGPPHDGPSSSTFTFLVTNPTALHQKASTFMELAQTSGAHFVGAAETSATLPVQTSFAAHLRRWKWRSCFSGPAPDHRLKADGGDSLRGKAVGTAAFSTLPLRPSHDQLPDRWRNSLRLLHVIVSLGVMQIQVFVLYGLVSPVQGSLSYNNALMDAAIEASERLPLPAVFMGDFNLDVQKLQGVQRLQLRGHCTLQECYKRRYGVNMPPTCKESTTPDTAILPPELVAGLSEINVLNDVFWFDSHHPVSFSVTLPGSQMTRLVMPRPQPLGDFMFDTDTIHAAWQDLVPAQPPITFVEWASLMEDTFDVALRKLPSSTGYPRSLPSKYRGRCKPKGARKRPIMALLSFQRPGEFQSPFEVHTMGTKALMRQLRRITSLKRHRKKFGPQPTDNQEKLMFSEWSAVCNFWYQGAPFVNWMQFWPELFPVPWDIPLVDWLYDLQQLVQFEVSQLLYQDQVAWSKKQEDFRRQDKRLQNSREAFRMIRSNAPSLHEVCRRVAQQGIAIPQPDCSFVEIWCEDPSQFAMNTAATYAGHTCHILALSDLHVLVSFSEQEIDLPAEGELLQICAYVEPGDIFDQLTGFWLPLWQRTEPESAVDPSSAAEFENYLQLLDPYHRVLQPDLSSPLVWEQAVSKLRPGSAPGFDGVRASELQLLPRDLLCLLGGVFNQYPDGFPGEIMAARTVPIPKVQTFVTANQIRPITILSQLYRLWAALICQQVLRTWAPILPRDITGLLARRSSFQAAYSLQWELELAHFEKRDTSGLTLDICKCFNMISQPRGFALLSRLGLAPTILAQWRGSLVNMTRRWELHNVVSPVLNATCGFPEGDIFSVLVMIATTLTWTLAIRCEVGPGPMLSAYADNWTWSSSNKAHFDGILKATLTWVSLMGLIIDWLKTWCWASSQDLFLSLKAALHRHKAPNVNRALSANDLGCPMRYQGAPRLGKLKSRLNAGRSRLLRIRDSMEELSTKVTLVTQGVYSSAFYGSEFLPLGEHHLATMRSQVANALIGEAHCATPCLVLLLASPRLRDPALHVILQACCAARRFLMTAPQTCQMRFFQCASSFRPRPNASKGPASTLQSYLARLGWALSKDGTLQITAFLRLHFLHTCWERLTWYADLAWQDRLLQCHTAKHSLSHLPNVSRAEGLQILGKFSDRERILLLREISGAYLTHQEQAIWDPLQSSKCDHCGQEDTREHRVFECSAFASVRFQYRRAVTYAQEMGTDWHLLPVPFEHPQVELRDMLQYRLPDAAFLMMCYVAMFGG